MNSPVSRTKFLEDTVTNPENLTNKQFHVFILVNSKSGSWHGRQLLEKYHQKSSFSHNQGRLTHFYACDLYIRKQKDLYFAQINRLASIGENVKIIMSGGDGTVQWVLSQALQYKVDFDRVVFGVLPIGTGNDFAKSIGWDRFKFKINDKKMQQLAVLLFQSQVGYYDVWQCTIKVNESGKIVEIKNGIQSQSTSKCLIKSFTNYFGIGSDAKITFIAQKINAKSVFAKKLSYTVAWLCSLISPAQKLKKVLKSFVRYKSNQSKIISSQRQFQLKNNLRATQAQDAQLQSLDIQLDQNDSCVTFLNSTVSMQLENIWKTPHSIVKDNTLEEQKIDDGKIQIVSYRNSMSIGLERAFHMAKKVDQGTGPFIFNFKNVQSQQTQTFIHINGQPYKITNIDSILIRKNKELPESRLKVVIFKN